MIDREEINYVAGLAMLSIEDTGFDKLAVDFQDIVSMVETLKTLPTDGVSMEVPMLGNRFRSDTVTSSLPREAVLSVAPAVEAGCVLVPRVVE